MKNHFPNIVSNAAILNGKPCIAGTRINVELIVDWLRTSGMPQSIAQKHPRLTFQSFRVLTDENVDFECLHFLRSTGFDVFDIKEQKLYASPDAAILQLALVEKRVVITQDSDFGTLIFRDHSPFSA